MDKRNHLLAIMLRIIGLLSVLALFAVVSPAANITLEWYPSSSENTGSYNFYVGEVRETGSCYFDNAANPHGSVSEQTSYTLDLENGRYCFAVTAVTTSAAESYFSNVIWYELGENIDPPASRTAVTTENKDIRFQSMNEAETLRETLIKYWPREAEEVCTYPYERPWNTMNGDDPGKAVLTADDMMEQTAYCYLIYTRDENENETVYQGTFTSGVFAPPPPQDQTPPVISEVNAEPVIERSASISWATDEITTGTLKYRAAITDAESNPPSYSCPDTTDGPEWATIDITEAALSHSQTITDLPADCICFQIIAIDAAGLLSEAPSIHLLLPDTSNQDKTPPVILEVKAEPIVAKSATINWTTDEQTTGSLKYHTASKNMYRTSYKCPGTTDGTGWTTIEIEEAALSHSRTITDLPSSPTPICFQIIATDAVGLFAEDTTIHMLLQDTTKPEIGNFAEYVNDTGTLAVLSWETNEPATEVVQWQKTDINNNCSFRNNYNKATSNANDLSDNTVWLDDLKPNVNYCYRIIATDRNGNKTTSTSISFRTTALLQEGPVVNADVNNIHISWISGRTDELVDFVIEYWNAEGNGAIVDAQTNDMKEYFVDLPTQLNDGDLLPDTTYYFHVSRRTADDNLVALSADVDFYVPAPDTTPPTINLDEPVVSPDSATVSWNTGEEKAYGQLIFWPLSDANSCGEPPADANRIPQEMTEPDTAHSVDLSNLEAETTYCYQVRAVDKAKNEATTDSQFTTPAQPEESGFPRITGWDAPVRRSSNSVSIHFTTDRESLARIFYKQYSWFSPCWDINGYNIVTDWSDSSFEHNIRLNGLYPGASYCFSIQTSDGETESSFEDFGGMWFIKTW